MGYAVGGIVLFILFLFTSDALEIPTDQPVPAGKQTLVCINLVALFSA
jgi:hypothetical protein